MTLILHPLAKSYLYDTVNLLPCEYRFSELTYENVGNHTSSLRITVTTMQ